MDGFERRRSVGRAVACAFAVLLSQVADASQGALYRSLQMLKEIPSGRMLIASALKTWNLSDASELIPYFRLASSSRTDAVLTRHLDLKTGEEVREKNVTVFLKSSQSLEELVLDMAHELVHATSRPDWDPYDPFLTPERYIEASVEGPGGEVDALMMECRVSIELSVQLRQPPRRCRRYIRSEARPPEINRERIRRDFYRVGGWKHRLEGAALVFPKLSTEEPTLFSSTGASPYPVALYEEYLKLTAIACENTRKRTESMSRRWIASGDQRAWRKSLLFLSLRCPSRNPTTPDESVDHPNLR